MNVLSRGTVSLTDWINQPGAPADRLEQFSEFFPELTEIDRGEQDISALKRSLAVGAIIGIAVGGVLFPPVVAVVPAAVLKLRNRSTQRVEHRVETVTPLVLLDFSCPDVPGALIELETTSTETAAADWKIGLGVAKGGRKNTVKLAKQSGFGAAPGERKHVVVNMATDAVYAVDYTYRGNPPLTPLPVALEPTSGPRKNSPPFTRSLPSNSVPGAPLEYYELSGDTSRQPVRYEYTYTRTSESTVSYGDKFEGVGLETQTTVTLESAVTLRFTLPPGHDYTLLSTADGTGITWHVA